MHALRTVLFSTLGRKYLTALTAAGLVLFVISHVAANLMLLNPDPTPFNAYSFQLFSLGKLLYIAEILLLIAAIVHVTLAVWLRIEAKKARPIGYAVARSKMGPSKWGFSSRTLALTGFVLLVFLIIHIKTFKFGPGIAEGYTTEIAGHEARDLYRWVKEAFQSPIYVGFYVFAMVLLGFHLKHGIWSIFQSLGATNSATSPWLYRMGIALAVLIAGGFTIIPIWIYFDLGARIFS